MLVYEGFNDVSSAHYNPYWMDSELFSFKGAKENPEGWDSYCCPLVFGASSVDYTFSANTLSATVTNEKWEFQTMFKVLIKTHASMDKDADYYNLQVKNTSTKPETLAESFGAWTVYPLVSYNYNVLSRDLITYRGWTGGVQEADGIAFYYKSFSASTANITFTLKEYGGTTKTYSVTGKTIAATYPDNINRCVGVALNYGSFE